MKATQKIQAMTRTARRLGWGHNALRRPTDRIEIATLVAAIVLAMAAVPLALMAGSMVYHHNLNVSAEQTATRHQITATLLEGTPTMPAGGDAVNNALASARWIGPDGSRHTGVVSAPQDVKAGMRVSVWTNTHGDLVDPPLNTAQAWGRGALGFVATMSVVGALLATGFGLVRRRLNRIRHAAWDAEWRQIDPWRTPTPTDPCSRRRRRRT